MNNKIVGFLVCILMVTATVLSAATFNNIKTSVNEEVRNTVTATQADPTEIQTETQGLNTATLSSRQQTKQQPKPLDVWDLQFYYDVGGDSGSSCLVGFGFDGEYFYAPESESSKIHKFEEDGAYIGNFSISGVPNLVDLAYDGEYFYGAAQSPGNVIYQMDFENEVLIDTITAPAAALNIAYDSDDDAFWIGEWQNHLIKIDREGNILDLIPPPESMLGITYDNIFEYEGYNGPFLWVFTGTSSYPDTPAIIKCIDIDSKELIPDFEHNVADELGPGIAGGLELTYKWDPTIIVLFGIVQGSGIDDYAFGYEVYPWWGYMHDVGVDDIVSPEDGYAGEDMEVIIQVRNHCYNTEEDIPVNVVILKDGIEEEYNEMEYIDVINPHETVVIGMPLWTPDDWQSVSNEYIDYQITAQVTLQGDENSDNDYKEKWFELYFDYLHDVGCTNVIGLESGPAQTFPVIVTIKNFGQYDECCFKTYIEISELDPEYEAYKCITTIKPGEEIELVFDDWTPDYLQHETTGIKNYTVKAWTGMDSPPDENPDNDLFAKSIKLEFYHDVGIKQIKSPSNGGGGYDRIFYAVDCSSGSGEFIWFDPEDPGTYYNIGGCPGTFCPQGATFVKGIMWFCDSSGMIYKKEDPMSPEYEFVGNAGTGELVGLAYHGKSKTLYGMSTSNLYTIDIDDGSATLVGSLGTSPDLMISLDCDRNGKMYAYAIDYYLDQAMFYELDLNDGHATAIGSCGFVANYGQDMAYDWETETMYACVFNYDNFQGEFHKVNLETGRFTYLGTLQNGAQTTCLAITSGCPPLTTYIPIGIQSIEAISGNIGTFPEIDMTCYAEIYEYFTNCTNGTLVYEDNITDIDILEPLSGTEILTFDDYDFTVEGVYLLKLNLTDDNDDYPWNNLFTWEIVCDDTPPISSHVLDPPVPDGDNGWYVSDLKVTLSALDPDIVCDIPGSWVKEINYIVNGEQNSMPGDWGTFTITEDGADIEVTYWAVDNVENIESNHTFYLDMDQTPPNIEVEWDAYKKNGKWYVKFTVEATDETSGMAKLEMYFNDGLYKTIIGPGPTYEFVIEWNDVFKTCTFKFVAFDMAGNSDYDTLDGEDITSLPRSQISVHQIIKAWLLRWLDRFPFLQRLKDIIVRYLC